MQLSTRTVAGLIAGAAIAALVAACDQRPSATSTPDNTNRTTNTATAPKPDNTINNQRDRDGTTTTPTDQGQSSSDIRIASDIRKALMDDTTLSTNGKNVKIVVKNGGVTLRGVVDTQAEKDTIESKARAVSGVVSVINDLEVNK